MKREKFGCRGSGDKIGVLIAQLGTPAAPSAAALRPYLKQFLGDPRVIEKPRWLWWLILNGIILRLRPARSAKLYQRIWTPEGSPLLLTTQKLTEQVAARLTERHETIETVYGMRYGEPSLEHGLDELIERGCSKILLFNMYPQYSATTSASNYDVVFAHLLKRRWVPTLRVAEPYYAHPDFIGPLAESINTALAEDPPERLVFSYHGIPEEYIEKGDPYCCQCSETTRALLPLLQIDQRQVIHTYQSRFGRDPWLVPYTDETIEQLARDGIKRIAVACPGFPSDCLETLDEIGNEAAEAFRELGGEELRLIPCLNDQPVWIAGMTELILKELDSWLITAERTRAADCKLACPVKQEKQRVKAAG